MVDWRSSMQQTYEYYTVDPNTWEDVKQIKNVKSCTINRDSTVDTLGSATIDVTDLVGESYIRAYLVTLQNGSEEKHPLGTFLVQTPSSSFNGTSRSVTMDAYTPLLELKENPPPLGYSILKDANIMQTAYMITRDHVRAPVVAANNDTKLEYDFVSEVNDNWLTFTRDLIANAKYEFGLDERGRVLYLPKQEISSLQPVWTYDDGNSSILYPEISLNHDLFGIPNVVEVVYSKDGKNLYARVVNDDPNSPTSTVNRGREIVHRETDPTAMGFPTETQLQEYARRLLRELSSVEYTVSYSHGYCGTRVGDCVRLNYVRSGIVDVKAKIISQTIKCAPGCPVTEKAVFTTKLWG